MIKVMATIDCERGLLDNTDSRERLKRKISKGDIWLEDVDNLDRADELYITQVNGMFSCTKFFPAFEKDFELRSRSKIKIENGIEFQFQIWHRKKAPLHEEEYSV